MINYTLFYTIEDLKIVFFLFSIYYIKKRFKLMNIYNILNINGTESNEE
jgi:hypothetical protein